MNPGIHLGVPHEVYRDALTVKPALNSGTVHRIVTQSPLHAWTNHPQLNPDYLPDEDSRMDLGSAAHAIVLEGKLDRIEVIDAKDWRTTAAKEARDKARTAGKIPVLAHKARQIASMADAAVAYLERSEIGPSVPTFQPEVTLIWEENGVLCKGRPDWLGKDHLWLVDFKTCEVAAPATIIRIATNMGYFTQVAFYRRGVMALTGIEPRCAIFAQEIDPPYACSLVGLPPALLAHENAKIVYAFRLWADCLSSGKWPAYSDRIAWADPLPWAVANWQERMSLDAMEAEQ